MIDRTNNEQFEAFCAVIGFAWDSLKAKPGVLEDTLKRFRLDPALAQAAVPELPGYDGFVCTAHLGLTGIERLAAAAEDNPDTRKLIEKNLKMSWEDAQRFIMDLKECLSVIVNEWPDGRERFDMCENMTSFMDVVAPILGQIVVQIAEQIEEGEEIGVAQPFQGGNFQAN